MKKFIFLLFSLFCISCAKEDKKPASIKVKTTTAAFIEVRNPVDDIILWDNKTDTIYPNEKNEFLFTKTIDKPEFARVIIGKKWLKVILLPGKEIVINPENEKVFEGTNKAGMELFNNFKHPSFSMNESNKYKNDSTAVQVQQKIKPLKQAELKELQELVATKKIDAALAEILQKEIDYFYAQRTAQVVVLKQYQSIPINDNLLALFDETLTTYPLQTSYKPSSWEMYTETVLKEKALYDALAKGTITQDTLQQYYSADKLHPYFYSLIKSFEDNEIAEKVAANYIISEAKQNKFEKSLISVFEQFQKEFPNSMYSEYLVPSIEKIRAYHIKISGEMPANVTFHKNEAVASLNDLMTELKGEQYYVDLWATWCGPCKKEFKHNDVLNTLLEEKGYKKLYISLDEAKQREKWKQDIKYFELGGLHLLASKEFFEDFAKNHSTAKGYVSIPQYLIIDKEGNLVTNDAPRPSDIDTLRKLLSQ